MRLLKDELMEEYEADKQAALTQLSQQKELEMMAARESWQRKVEDLLEQVQVLDQFYFLHPHSAPNTFDHISPSKLYLPLLLGY